MLGMLGGLGVTELVIILAIILIIFGVGKLPEIGGGMGQAIRNFKKASNEPEAIDVTPEQRAEDSAKAEVADDDSGASS